MAIRNLMGGLVDSVFRPVLVAVMAIVAANCNEGCKPPGSSLDDVYRAQLQACVAVTETPRDACLCRKVVDTKWGLCLPEVWPRVGRCDHMCDGDEFGDWL